MANEMLEKEIADLTAQLNSALKKMEEQDDGFIDKKHFDEIFEINKQLGHNVKLKNSL